ncbi:hypothetical protein [Labilibaculum euxinus]|uniref:Transposase n=1 Tax=Labilibaculum euxinus TaxID=2686357 RepID=A0A7M4DBW0_9BACT|nr:hypothetical protein [Labilibaculum euxinus]MUP40139.1 hypothetical protein [Labilibaculum euxinus]MVB09344.1 hypothetical protein [Labilibaculum euxinus]
MEKGKECMLTDQMSGFKKESINYNSYEISFRRWLISEIDADRMSIQEARDRFKLSPSEYKRILKRWQERYSDQLHLSLQAMSSKERSDNSKLDQRIKELEKKLELAQLKNVALNTMIDIAEKDYKLSIRKKSGPKQ